VIAHPSEGPQELLTDRRVSQRLAAARCLPLGDPLGEEELADCRERFPDVVARYEDFFESRADLFDDAAFYAPVCVVSPWSWPQACREAPTARDVLSGLLWSRGRMAEWMAIEQVGTDTLRPYTLVVLFGLEAMDEWAFNAVKGFVMAGGHAIAVGPTGRCDASGHPRPDEQVDDLFGPRHTNQEWDTIQTRLAKGRATSFPTVTIEQLADDVYVRKQFLQEVDQLAGPRPVAHDGPPELVTCLTAQPHASRLILHFVNRGTQPLEAVRVAVLAAVPESGSIELFSPDAVGPEIAAVTHVPAGIHFQLRGLDVYAILVLPIA